MKRTTIHLPADLRARAKRLAKARGVTLSALFRQALEREVAQEKGAVDSLFRTPAWTGEVPADLSARVDDYLYDGDA
jgi:hypothetical protein